MLLDSDTFFPSSPHPSEDTLADGLVGWDWSPDTAANGGASAGVVVEDSVEAYNTQTPLSLYAVPSNHQQRLQPQNPNSPSTINPPLLPSLQQQRPTNVVLGRATSPNLNNVSSGLPSSIHQSHQSASDYTGLFPYNCKYEEGVASPNVTTSGAQYAAYNAPSSTCSTPSSMAVSSLVSSSSPEQKAYYDSSPQGHLSSVDQTPTDVQSELMYIPLDGNGMTSPVPAAILSNCDASGKLQQQHQQIYAAQLTYGEEVGDTSTAAGAWMLKYEPEGQMCMTTQTTRRGRPKRCKGDVKRGGKSDSENNAEARRPGAAARALGDVTCYRGVYFDAIRHLWRANWPEESVIIDKSTRNVIDVRRCTRTKGFSAKKFGYQEAQRMAIEHREKMTGPGMVRHYVYQQDAAQPQLPPGGRSVKQDLNS